DRQGGVIGQRRTQPRGPVPEPVAPRFPQEAPVALQVHGALLHRFATWGRNSEVIRVGGRANAGHPDRPRNSYARTGFHRQPSGTARRSSAARAGEANTSRKGRVASPPLFSTSLLTHSDRLAILSSVVQPSVHFEEHSPHARSAGAAAA